MVSWLRRHWETSADPGIVGQCVTTSAYGTLLVEPSAHKDTEGLSNYSGIGGPGTVG